MRFCFQELSSIYTRNEPSKVSCKDLAHYITVLGLLFLQPSFVRLEYLGFTISKCLDYPGEGGRCGRAASNALSWNARDFLHGLFVQARLLTSSLATSSNVCKSNQPSSGISSCLYLYSSLCSIAFLLISSLHDLLCSIISGSLSSCDSQNGLGGWVTAGGVVGLGREAGGTCA